MEIDDLFVSAGVIEFTEMSAGVAGLSAVCSRRARFRGPIEKNENDRESDLVMVLVRAPVQVGNLFGVGVI